MNKLNVTSLQLCSIFSVLAFNSLSQACIVRSKCSTLQVHSMSLSIRCQLSFSLQSCPCLSTSLSIHRFPELSTTASKPLLYLYVSKDLPNSLSQYILNVVHYKLIHLSIFIICQLGFFLYQLVLSVFLSPSDVNQLSFSL